MVLPTLDELHQPWATHTSSTTWSTPPTKVCYSILEKLYSESWVKATQQDVNTSRCLNKKWQPHFELKRWVWPMIKWSHLTPKSIYSYIDDLVIANCLIDAKYWLCMLCHIFHLPSYCVSMLDAYFTHSRTSTCCFDCSALFLFAKWMDKNA